MNRAQNLQDTHCALTDSALTLKGMHSEEQLMTWFAKRSSAHKYSVERLPLSELLHWSIDSVSGDLSHKSGKFFRITGIDVEITTDHVRRWSQPIILQPEIGILGMIAKRFDGVLHLLVQAKMEPGNVNLVQISPTVQATRSNYLQVHGGRRPPLVDYFIQPGRGIILLDQLQSEQGARYLRKRNRNMIVQLGDKEELSVSDDFIWVTLGQLHQLHKVPNLVHLDCRSILGSLTLSPRQFDGANDQSVFENAVLASLACSDASGELSLAALFGWLTRVKVQTELKVRLIPLCEVSGWRISNGILEHESERFFKVIGVDVRASNREVNSWTQPLIQNLDGGILGLLAQSRRGVMHFLVQARVEPGLIDGIELAPTVQYCPANYELPISAPLPPFAKVFDNLIPNQVRVTTMLSEEGGRFYCSQQRHLIAELGVDAELKLPENFCWVTLAQLHYCARFSNLLNIELRSLLSCIPLL